MNKKTILILFIFSFLLYGCGFSSYSNLKSKIKPKDLTTKIVNVKFKDIKKVVTSNTLRCFPSTYMYSADSNCTIHTSTNSKLELSCIHKGVVITKEVFSMNVIDPYIKVEKIDKNRSKVSIYGGYGRKRVIWEWINNEHQMCPSIL